MVSFTNATLVLSIGETVEEVTDSGFLGTSPTIACSRLGDDALIQVSQPGKERNIRIGGRIIVELVLKWIASSLFLYIRRCTLRVFATSVQTSV